MSGENLLLIADSEHDADMLYAVGMFVPDPFIYLRIRGKCHIVMSDLEIDRARKEAPGCKIISLSSCLQRLHRERVKKPGLPHVVRLVMRMNRLRKIFVSPNFPHGLARQLRDLKIKIKIVKGGVFPERALKNADEIKKISAALMMAEVGLSEGIQALKSSKIAKDGRLLYHNVPLTSEKLRSIIDIAIIQAGGLASHTIVAGGKQGADPHEQGHGPLRANQPIILDVFPRSQKTGYFGDITRTVVKGRANETVRRVYATVARAQEAAFNKMRHGVSAAEVHKTVQRLFDQEGFKTGKAGGRMQGFFHGTGHGLGLQLHEAPRVGSSSDDVLKTGQVVTVEPGLYYPAWGGVRLEDVAVISKSNARNLTKFEKILEV